RLILMSGYFFAKAALSAFIDAFCPPRTSWSHTRSVTVARFDAFPPVDVGCALAAPNPARATRAMAAVRPTVSFGTLLEFMRSPLPMLFVRSPGRALQGRGRAHSGWPRSRPRWPSARRGRHRRPPLGQLGGVRQLGPDLGTPGAASRPLGRDPDHRRRRDVHVAGRRPQLV